MPLVLFSFALNTDAQEATTAGNINAPTALQILQQIVIAEAVKKALEAESMVEGYKKLAEEKDATE